MRRIACVLALAAIGCIPLVPTMPRYFTNTYDYELSSVQRPANARQRYGAQTLTKTADSGITKYTFQDDLVSAILVPSTTRIALRLQNKTDHSIRVVWNDAAFVDEDGKSSPIMHVGVKYTECSGSKAVSVVVQHAMLDDEAIPCAGVSFSSGWSVYPIVWGGPIPLTDTATKFPAERQARVGKHVKLLLPLQVEDVTNDYLFEFVITGYKVSEFRVGSYSIP